MAQSARASDADVIMRLYDLRREDRMRQARNWFFAKFKGVKTSDEFLKLAPFGSDENAFFRMVVSYWDMAAGFVNSGAVNADLFFRSGNEMLFVWIRASELIAELRETRGNPLMYGDLEQAAGVMIKWLNDRAPGSYEGFRKMVLG
jgi:hypothetical protein